MDEIIKNNDKFETIRVIMELLCKELGVSKEAQLDEIGGALANVWKKYYDSMEDWRNIAKQTRNEK